jgi:uncharacterized protein YbjQ (UPF0145 family)
MIVVNTDSIAGYEIIEIRGLVQGNTVRAKHAGRDIAASSKISSVANCADTRNS